MSTEPTRRGIALAWLPAALYLLMVWWLSSQFNVPLDGIFMHDKGIHFAEFGVLGACFAYAVSVTWPGRGVRGALTAFLFTAASGLLDELHQVFVPGRAADVADLAADALGAACMVSIVWTLQSYLVRRSRATCDQQPTAPVTD